MTGFATASGEVEDWRWSCELRSVNSKGLDIRLRLSDLLNAMEPKIRALISEYCKRGNVTFSFRLERTSEASLGHLNTKALDQYLSAASEISVRAKSQGMELGPPKPTDFLQLKGVLGAEDEEIVLPEEAILATVKEALTDFSAMRRQEGVALAGLLNEQIAKISGLTEEAVQIAGERSEETKRNLKRNLDMVVQNADGVDADRVAQELAILAVKADITEELDRLGAHVKAAKELLKTDGPIGRKFDFLMQEFNREANTLCSKSGYAELTRVGLDMKLTIDQAREQVQNVE